MSQFRRWSGESFQHGERPAMEEASLGLKAIGQEAAKLPDGPLSADLRRLIYHPVLSTSTSITAFLTLVVSPVCFLRWNLATARVATTCLP